ncbi:MAG TPA: Virginiamycin B lyase, partial [Ktedonobacterales bacterium]|nr:Virginiamycin B lyase [Ktedonobacterales bacterium]
MGPDGALWFTTPDAIGRITLSGTITYFPLPMTIGDAQGITSGPDGALWFAEVTGDAIGRLTPSGQFSEYS